MEILRFSVLVARKRQVSLLSKRYKESMLTNRNERRLVPSNLHHVLWMIVHTRIPQVETLQVSHGCTFNLTGKLEDFAEANKLRQVIDDQRMFVCNSQILYFA